MGNRLLFRLLMNLAGSAGLRSDTRVGVQRDPDEHSLAAVERRSLERDLGGDHRAGLSLGELDRHLAEEAPPRAEEARGDGS